MRIPGLSRGWLIASALSLGVVVIAVLLLFVVYPRVGAWMIRSKVGGRLAARLGREIQFGAIDVGLGHAAMRDVEVRGPLDGDTPLIHVDRIDVDFNTWGSLVGSVELGAAALDGVLVTLHRCPDGQDNVRDVLARLRDNGGDGGGGGGLGVWPASIAVTRGRLLANDDATGATALIADADARWTPGGMVAHARGVTAMTLSAPRASAAKVDIEKVAGATPVVSIEGGELSLWPRLALSGIDGRVVANPARPGTYVIELAGGYGGVPGRLWTAKGGFEPKALAGSIDLEAAKFQLDRLAPILEHSAVVDYAQTSVDTKLHLDVGPAGAKFSGSFHMTGLNVGHPMIAEREVHNLDLSAQIAGSFERAGRKLELTEGDFVTRNVPFSITGTITAPPRPVAGIPLGPGPAAIPPDHHAPDLPATDKRGPERRSHEDQDDKRERAAPEPPRAGPYGLRTVKLRLVIPPVPCQRAIEAIPAEMAPYMTGYKLRGMFDTDVHMDIDWSDLDATQLDGHIGINRCKVLDEPADSPKRLKEEFEHRVEVDQGEWIAFDVGPSNDQFVPLDQVSPYLIKSIMSTEDSAFYQHRGFIPSEFRTALVNNLKAGKFVQGASSITMQMVKNVLLYREKTLARKLQELFLTWHVENTLDKDRILEIYLNVIEYGPGLYGIGPAAYHFFGKKPKDLNPVEAAFFSTILPSPKERYKQYCQGTLTKWTMDKIDRILQIMRKRDRLTQGEYDAAIATPLLFSKDGMESEDDCMKRVKNAINNARPTNPLADKSAKAKKDGKKDKKPDHRDKRRDSAARHDDKLPI